MQIASGKTAKIARRIIRGCARADFDGHQQKSTFENRVDGARMRTTATKWQRIGQKRVQRDPERGPPRLSTRPVEDGAPSHAVKSETHSVFFRKLSNLRLAILFIKWPDAR
jgi:hypothetical protein